MRIVEINWEPTRTDLRVFGIGLAMFCAIIAGLWHRADDEFAVVQGLLAGAAFIAIVIGWLSPVWLRPIYFVFVVLAFPIGWLLSHVLLALVFYGVFTPIGLVMRLGGRDPMQRRFDPDAETYWVPHDPPRPTEDYFRQF